MSVSGQPASSTTSVQDQDVATTTVPSAGVFEGAFTFAEDDLSAWVSVEMVAEFVAAEFDDPDVTVVLDENSGGPENPGSCQWWFLASTAPGEFGSISVGDAGDQDWAEDQDRVFGVADRVVQELGWLG